MAELYFTRLRYENVVKAYRAVTELLIFETFQPEHTTTQNTPYFMLFEVIFLLYPQVHLLG